MASVGRKVAANFAKGKNSLKKRFSGMSGDGTLPDVTLDDAMCEQDSRDSPGLPAQSPSPRRVSGYGEFGLQKSHSNISMPSTFNRPKKSNSIGSINSECVDSPMVDQDDILSLTQDVRNFSDALAKLKSVFLDDMVSNEDKYEGARIAAHERLGEVLHILKNVLQKYPALHSTEVLTSAGLLISKIKNYDYEDGTSEPTDFYDAIDQLALAFSSSVSEYLMGDVEASYTPTLGKTRSDENLSSMYSEDTGLSVEPSTKTTGVLTPAEIDSVLLKLESGVDLALQRAKAWSRYAKDIMTYVEKRALLEVDYAKNISKLAQTMRPIVTEESFLPFQSIYCTAMDHDADYAVSSQATSNLIQTQKFLEPLNLRRNEHDKARKQIKDNWMRELKKMQDAVGNLRKARSLYIQRQQEYEKAKETSQKVESESLAQSGGLQKIEKKRKAEDDAMHRALEAETTYKACVMEANMRQMELEKVKGNMLSQVRELVYQCEQTMKSVTVNYFRLQHMVTAPAPVQNQTLCESSRLYEPGAQYAEYVRRLPIPNIPAASSEPFVFEPFVPERLSSQQGRKRSSQSTESRDSVSSNDLLGDDAVQSPGKQKGTPRSSQPIKAWGQPGVESSESESHSGSSNKSRDSSPSASPYDPSHRRSGNNLGDLVEDVGGVSNRRRPVVVETSPNFRGTLLSKTASTHTWLRRLKAPSVCRECKSYVYFNGAECKECGVTCHRKCLESLDLPCGFNERIRQRRMTTFGVDFNAHLTETKAEIPKLVSKCVAEIDKRGMDVKGIYRVSGVKSRVEKLCQSFEDATEDIDLSDHHPNTVANVLKLYLRQLPEPLLIIKLYSDFIGVAKEDMNRDAGNTDRSAIVANMKELVEQLPKANYRTLAVIMHHLLRVTAHEATNQMNSTNLGIVFGPTLLRPSEGTASLSSLMDTPHQTRAIEIMITSAEEIFGATGMSQPQESQPQKTAVESLEPTPEEGTTSGVADSSVNESAPKLVPAESLDLMEDIMRTINKSDPAQEAQDPSQGAQHEFMLPGTADRSERSDEPSQDGATEDLSSDEDDELPDALLPDDSHCASALAQALAIVHLSPSSLSLAPQAVKGASQPRSQPSTPKKEAKASNNKGVRQLSASAGPVLLKQLAAMSVKPDKSSPTSSSTVTSTTNAVTSTSGRVTNSSPNVTAVTQSACTSESSDIKVTSSPKTVAVSNVSVSVASASSSKTSNPTTCVVPASYSQSLVTTTAGSSLSTSTASASPSSKNLPTTSTKTNCTVTSTSVTTAVSSNNPVISMSATNSSTSSVTSILKPTHEASVGVGQCSAYSNKDASAPTGSTKNVAFLTGSLVSADKKLTVSKVPAIKQPLLGTVKTSSLQTRLQQRPQSTPAKSVLQTSAQCVVNSPDKSSLISSGGTLLTKDPNQNQPSTLEDSVQSQTTEASSVRPERQPRFV